MAQETALPVIAVTGMAFEARIARGEGVQTVYAARSDLLERALAAALARGASGVISFGTAGGLAADLAAGTLIVADAIDGPAGRIPIDPAWRERIVSKLAAAPLDAPWQCGVLAGVAAPLTHTEQKAALNRARGALAVDMESHVAAMMAQAHGLPFMACRAIVDPAWRALPAAAIAGLRDDGTTALMPILASLARAPSQLGAMIRLAGDARAARATLTEARRILGLAFARP